MNRDHKKPLESSRIEIIIGCMFSGKSTELLRRLNRYNAINFNTLLINNANDTRTENSIKTHDNVVKTAIKVNNLIDLFTTYKKEYQQADVIGIDEAQFFPDLLDFVLKSERDNKIIIIAGLDGDSNRKPFGQILDCIPLCDHVIKLSAMDMVSKDGTFGIFTKRIVDDDNLICIGSNKEYMAVSRKNYLAFS